MRGGKRKGAGRKAGAITKKTRLIAEKALLEIEVADGVTPLEVLLIAMRGHAAAQNWYDAVSIAIAAAPYLHPKLSAVEIAGKGGGPVRIERIERVIVDPQNSDA